MTSEPGAEGHQEAMLAALKTSKSRAEGHPETTLKELLKTSEQIAEPHSETIVTEAQGFVLHRSPKSATGYTGVARRHCRGHQRMVCGYQASVYLEGGKMRHLGTFATSVQAAVVYARFLQELGR